MLLLAGHIGEMQTHAVADLEKRQQSIAEVVKPLVDTLHLVASSLARSSGFVRPHRETG